MARLSLALVLMMFVAIGFIAILTGAIAERFLAGQIEEVTEVAEETEATEADPPRNRRVGSLASLRARSVRGRGGGRWRQSGGEFTAGVAPCVAPCHLRPLLCGEKYL